MTDVAIFHFFIEFTGHTHFKVIMFDVDSKDASVGISSPPRPFVTREFLATVKQCLCHSHGEHTAIYDAICDLDRQAMKMIFDFF